METIYNAFKIGYETEKSGVRTKRIQSQEYLIKKAKEMRYMEKLGRRDKVEELRNLIEHYNTGIQYCRWGLSLQQSLYENYPELSEMQIRDIIQGERPAEIQKPQNNIEVGMKKLYEARKNVGVAREETTIDMEKLQQAQNMNNRQIKGARSSDYQMSDKTKTTLLILGLAATLAFVGYITNALGEESKEIPKSLPNNLEDVSKKSFREELKVNVGKKEINATYNPQSNTIIVENDDLEL